MNWRNVNIYFLYDNLYCDYQSMVNWWLLMFGSRFLKRRSVLAVIFVCSLLYFLTSIYKQVCNKSSSYFVPCRPWLLFSVWATPTYRPYSGCLECVICHTVDSLATVQMSVPAHWRLCWCWPAPSLIRGAIPRRMLAGLIVFYADVGD